MPRSLWGAPFKLLSGGFDLVAKASEGIKNSASLQTQRLDRQRHPLAIYPDRLVRQYAPNESAAYALLSLCEPDALHSQGRRAEAYVYHHTIDYRPPIPGAPRRTTALHLPYISPTSPLYLPCISHVSPQARRSVRGR